MSTDHDANDVQTGGSPDAERWRQTLALADIAPARRTSLERALEAGGERSMRGGVVQTLDTLADEALDDAAKRQWQARTAHISRRMFAWVPLREIIPALLYLCTLARPDEDAARTLEVLFARHVDMMTELPFFKAMYNAVSGNLREILDATHLVTRVIYDHGHSDIDFPAPGHAIMRGTGYVAEAMAVFMAAFYRSLAASTGVEAEVTVRVPAHDVIEVEMWW